MTSNDRFQRSPHYLWISTEIFVPLNEQGFIHEDVPCLEGSVGYIIQAYNRDDPSIRYAWKIPRLLGDSLTENQYISQLLIAEARHAIRLQACPAVLAGIGPAGNPFERPVPGIRPASSPPSRGSIAKDYLLVQYGKGRKPRFSSVSFDRTSLHLSPTPDALALVKRPSLVVDLQHALEDREYAQYIPDPRPSAGDSSYIAALVDIADGEQVMGGWYLKLPSVLYNWADGTLQEAISEGTRSNWTPKENLALVARLLVGLKELHAKKLLHGDLRPANIMYLRDPGDPEDYALTDYGSLATGDADRFENNASLLANDRTLFQAITNPRSSQFYAPERRHGYEHEEADLVLLVPVMSYGLKLPQAPLDGAELTGWLLVVGWRNAIEALKCGVLDTPGNLDAPRDRPPRRPPSTSYSAPGDGVPRPDLESSALGALLRSLADEFSASPRPTPSPLEVNREMRLHPGDRVRFREYVFRIKSITEREIRSVSPRGAASTKLTVMFCDRDFWKVFTERLIIIVTNPATEFPLHGRTFEELSVPKMVELYRWSQATDIFAIGALALYALFPRDPGRESREVEREFSSLLEILENPAFFRRIWPDLDFTCRKVEETLAEDRAAMRPPSDFASRQIHGARQAARSEVSAGEPRSIRDIARDTASSLSQTAPYAHDVLTKTFRGNVAHFCLVMRFILACLHRRTSCSPEWDAEQVRPPYSRSRIEGASRGLAAERALADVRELRTLLDDERLASLGLSASECAEIPQFVDQGKTETIMRNLRLTKDLADEREQREVWRSRAHALQRRLNEQDEAYDYQSSIERAQFARLAERTKQMTEIALASATRLQALVAQRDGSSAFWNRRPTGTSRDVLQELAEALVAEASQVHALLTRATR